MAKFITFGEVLVRLKTTGNERFFQSQTLEATFGGAEYNVAVSLANYGLNVGYVTALPDNEIADAAIGELRGFGVDINHIRRQGGRIGTYYLEQGASHRSSSVIYDRSHSSLCDASAEDFDWDSIFGDVTWYHTSGITPAISQSAADITLASMKAAKKRGITVSLDLNYRSKLWNYGRSVHEIMPELISHADIAISGREDCQNCLNINVDPPAVEDIGNLEHFEALSEKMLEDYPNLKTMAITLRQSLSVEHHRWSACLRNSEGFIKSRIYDVENIIDRVGTGDAFSGGLIYAMSTYNEMQSALDFAVAAACLKHSIPGDVNRVSVDEVKEIIKGESKGRVQR